MTMIMKESGSFFILCLCKDNFFKPEQYKISVKLKSLAYILYCIKYLCIY